MSYTDQKYYGRPQILVGDNRSFGTATASGAAGFTLSTLTELPKFIKRTQLNTVRLKVRTAPNAAATGLIAIFLNGTNTHGTAVLTTATAGQTVDFTNVNSGSYGTFTSGAQPTLNLVGTSTASGGTAGAYDIFFEAREMYDSSTVA